MADLRNYQARVATAGTRADAAIDEGLRAYMLKVYNLMAMGLAVTGVAALATVWMATTQDPAQAVGMMNNHMLTAFGAVVYGSPLRWVLFLAPLALVFFMSFRIHKLSVPAAQTTFWVFAGLLGMSISSIFLVYTAHSVVQTFFITAAAFGALSARCPEWIRRRWTNSFAMRVIAALRNEFGGHVIKPKDNI
jgi:FtsH-binding integral membrane protein